MSDCVGVIDESQRAWASDGTAARGAQRPPNRIIQIPLERLPPSPWLKKRADVTDQPKPQRPDTAMPAQAQRWPAGSRRAESRFDSGMYRQSYSEGYRNIAISTPNQKARTATGSAAQTAQR